MKKIYIQIDYESPGKIILKKENSSKQLIIKDDFKSLKDIGLLIAAYLEDVANDDLDKYKNIDSFDDKSE